MKTDVQNAGRDAAALWDEVSALEKKLKETESALRDAEKKRAREVAQHAAQAASALVPEILAEADNSTAVVRIFEGNGAALQQIGGGLKKKVQVPVVLVANEGGKLGVLVISASEEPPANTLLTEVVTPFGGKGGGRADFAQGAIPAGADVQDVVRRARELLGLK